MVQRNPPKVEVAGSNPVRRLIRALSQPGRLLRLSGHETRSGAVGGGLSPSLRRRVRASAGLLRPPRSRSADRGRPLGRDVGGGLPAAPLVPRPGGRARRRGCSASPTGSSRATGAAARSSGARCAASASSGPCWAMTSSSACSSCGASTDCAAASMGRSTRCPRARRGRPAAGGRRAVLRRARRPPGHQPRQRTRPREPRPAGARHEPGGSR